MGFNLEPVGGGGNPTESLNNNNFKIFINSIEYTSNINYPVEIIDKNLDESFSSLNISLNRMIESDPFTTHKQVQVQWFVDGSLFKDLYCILVADTVEKIGNTNLFKHNLSLVEYTYFLDLLSLPDMTITRAVGGYEPTLKDVVDRILHLAGWDNYNSSLGITLNTETNTLLSNSLSPEWTFTRMTAMEALRMVFGYIKIIPEMMSFNILGHASIQEENEVNFFNFSGFSNAYNPQTYRTRLVSDVSNFIAEGAQQNSVVEPANGWMTPRSPDGFEISNDNAIIPTSKPIYNVQGLYAKVQLVWVEILNSSITQSVLIDEDLIPYHYFKEWTPFLYEEERYNTLSNTENIGGRGHSLFYKQGSKNIEGLSNISPTKWSWIPNQQAWKNIYDTLYSGTGLTLDKRLEAFIKPEHLAEVRATLLALGYDEFRDGTTFRGFAINTDLDNGKIQNLRFKIEYVPYIQTKVYSYKEKKNTNDIVTSQYYNQQANVISSKVLADLHDRVSKSNTGSEIKVNYLHKNVSDLLSTGKRVQDYVITTASLSIFQNSILANYNLDEFFTKLNTYVSVLEKWRQFSIPSENIVTHQFNIIKFAKFSTSQVANSTPFVPNFYLGTGEIQLFHMDQLTTNLKTLYPSTSFPFNNAIVFEAKTPMSASAGSKSVLIDSNKRRDEPVVITDTLGRIDEDIRFMFLTQLPDQGTLQEAYDLPLAPGVTPIVHSPYFEVIPFKKDARELLEVSFQLHHIDTTGKVYINRGWSEVNGLVGGIGINNSEIFKATLLKRPFNTEYIESSDILGISGASFTSNASGSIVVPTITNGSTTTDAESWAIVERTEPFKYRILFWVDEKVEKSTTTSQLYINFDNSY